MGIEEQPHQETRRVRPALSIALGIVLIAAFLIIVPSASSAGFKGVAFAFSSVFLGAAGVVLLVIGILSQLNKVSFKYDSDGE